MGAANMTPCDIYLGNPGSNPFPSVCGRHEVEMLITEYVRICQKRNDWRPVVLTEFNKGNAYYMDEAINGQWFEWVRGAGYSGVQAAGRAGARNPVSGKAQTE